MALSIANIIRVSILAALRGLADANTSSLALITDEEPIPVDFGSYRIYLEPSGVASDFGSNSDTYRLAVMIFSQTPNILTGRGYLIVIPRSQAASAQPATLVGSNSVNFTKLTATDYIIRVDIDDGGVVEYSIGSIDSTSMATILTSLNSSEITGAGLTFEITGDISSAIVTLKTVATGSAKSIEIDTTPTTGGTDISGLLFLSGLANGADAGVEKVKDAILRTCFSLGYFGIILNVKLSDADLFETAALIQSLDKILVVGSNLTADITGIFKDILDAGYTHTRCVFYSNSETEAIDFAAGYAGRGFCVNFSAANSVLTMNLKDIAGLTGDDLSEGTSGQTYYDLCKTYGVDTYFDFGVPKVTSSGVNNYFDEIYIKLALKLKLQVAGFNYLAQTITKIPQTEQGMDGLKGAYRKIIELFKTAGAFAPGAWNSSTTFGDPEEHIRNIADTGYYIYSQPVSSQLQIERTARIAPVIQIAAKSSGAIHSSDVIVFLEA